MFLKLLKCKNPTFETDASVRVCEGRQEVDIPEERKAIVRERITKSNPEDLVTCEEARSKFKFREINL